MADKWISDIYRRYGVNPDWIETGKGKMFIAERDGNVVVPEYKSTPHIEDRLCAGDGSFEVNENISDYWMFRTDWLKRKGSPSHMVLIDIYGNSMEPELKDGDTVLIDTSEKDILAGANMPLELTIQSWLREICCVFGRTKRTVRRETVTWQKSADGGRRRNEPRWSGENSSRQGGCCVICTCFDQLNRRIRDQQVLWEERSVNGCPIGILLFPC